MNFEYSDSGNMMKTGTTKYCRKKKDLHNMNMWSVASITRERDENSWNEIYLIVLEAIVKKEFHFNPVPIKKNTINFHRDLELSTRNAVWFGFPSRKKRNF